MNDQLLIDTGVFLAAADSSEPRNPECSAFLRNHRNNLTTTALVIAETSWLVESRLGPKAESRFLSLVASGQLKAIDLTRTDYQRCIELISQYTDLGLGVVDASLVAVAERYRIEKLATLNTRDFHVVRPAHANAFEILP